MKNWNEESRSEQKGPRITDAQYHEVLKTVYKRNKEVLMRFSLISGGLFLFMLVMTFINPVDAQNRLYYLVMLGVQLGFYAVFRLTKDNQKNLITVLNYLFFLVAFVYSAVITYVNPRIPAVAFHIFLIMMPEMLIDRPVHIISFMSIVSALFCLGTVEFKPIEVALTDICNVLWVLFLSIALTAQHVKLRLTGLVVRQQIESERDLDSLTGFFTKNASRREVQKRMATHPVGAFVFLDIDNFKHINDTYGHDFGDEVLRKLADYLRSYNHTTEVCGRFGGDEFLVYISDFNNKEAVFQRVHFLLSNLKNNLDYPELDVHPKLSAGIAFYPEDGTDYDALLRNADSAMYYSKHHGKARVTAYSEASTKMAHQKN